jgi:hypothetical protein
MKVMAVSILSRNPTDLLLLMSLHSFLRAAMIQMITKFYLNKAQNIIIPTDKIDFSRAPLVFASHYFVAVIP